MATAAVITEYNPFHYGHMHQITELKKHFDTVVCIMSGFAVQRGGFAVADKYTRAKAAVDCGASLVVELPYPFSGASARDFAAAGVNIASRMNADMLAFGAEDCIDPLYAVCDAREKGVLDEKTRQYLKNGVRSYPLALCEAVRETVGAEAADMLKKPNNILACEYIFRARKNGIGVYPMRRNMSFKSAGEIRSNTGGFIGELPENSARAFLSGCLLDTERADVFLLSRLYDRLGYVKKDDVYAATDDALCRLSARLNAHTDIESLVSDCADGSHTAAYYRRLVCSVAFGVTPEMPASTPTYTVLLAADADGRRHLGTVKDINVITKPSSLCDGMGRYAIDAESAVSRCCMQPSFDPYRAKPYIGDPK